MRPDELVPSRETCERLKAAGFPQETWFRWAEDSDRRWDVLAGEDLSIGEGIAAPTCAEIAERLWASGRAKAHGVGPCVKQNHSGNTWIAWDWGISAFAKSATEAAALLWLALNEKERQR